jgi:type IV pilus assembly protein PilW
MSKMPCGVGTRQNLPRQRGIGVVEIMVSLAIALVLLLGLTTVFISTKHTYTAQSDLAQLQNNQFLALSILDTVIQAAGYYPNTIPPTQTLNVALPAQTISAPMTGAFTTGQAVFGGSISGADSVAVRAVGTMDCSGNSSANLVVSTFTVSNNSLQCSIDGAAAQVLVNGVASMTLLYGVGPSGSGSVTRYVTAANVTNWENIISISITLNFINPLDSSAPIPITHVISVMGQI